MSWFHLTIKLSQIPAEQLFSVLWYHGTDSATAYGLLNDMTLRTREETGESSYEGSLSSIQSAVYLTSTPGKAAKHAIDRVEQYKGTHPVILVIQPENLGYVHVDEDLVHMLFNGNDHFENDWYPSPTLVQEIFDMAAEDLNLDDWDSDSPKSAKRLVLEHFQYQNTYGGNEDIEDEYFQEEGITPDDEGNYEYDESMHLAKRIAADLNAKHQTEAIQNFRSMAHLGSVVASEIYLIPQYLNKKMDDGSTWQDSPTSLVSYEELQQYGTRIDPKQLLMPFMTQSSKQNWLQKLSQSLPPSSMGVGHGYRWDDEKNEYQELWQSSDREPVLLWLYENEQITEEVRTQSNLAHWSDSDDARGRIETGTGRGSVIFDPQANNYLRKNILESLVEKYPGIKFGVYESGGPYSLQDYWKMLESGQI